MSDTNTTPETGAENTNITPTPENGQGNTNTTSVLADLVKERKRRQELQQQVDKLSTDLAEALKDKDKLDSLSKRHTRLEALLAAEGSQFAELMDSKKFTSKLYETEDDVNTILQDWLKTQSRTAIDTALQANSAGSTTGAKLGDILRAIAHG